MLHRGASFPSSTSLQIHKSFLIVFHYVRKSVGRGSHWRSFLALSLSFTLPLPCFLVTCVLCDAYAKRWWNITYFSHIHHLYSYIIHTDDNVRACTNSSDPAFQNSKATGGKHWTSNGSHHDDAKCKSRIFYLHLSPSLYGILLSPPRALFHFSAIAHSLLVI